MADFLKEYFYDMSDRLGGYPAGGDNKRSNTARWVDIINGLAFLPMQQQGMGTPSVPSLPGMNSLFGGGVNNAQNNIAQQDFGGYYNQNNYQAPAQNLSFVDKSQYKPTRNILREIYGNPRAFDTDIEAQMVLSELAKNNY